MNTGLILFLIFLALSIIDSVARTRRSKQVAPPPEEDEEWPAEGPSVEAGQEVREKKARASADEFLDLEKLMGSGYLDRLMGPGFAGVMEEEEEDVPARTAPPARPAATPETESASSRGRDGRRVAREGRTPDQARRRAEATGRRSGIDQPPKAEGRRLRAERRLPEAYDHRLREADRRLPDREDAGSRPARVARETARLQDSAVDRDRDRLVPMPVGPPGSEPRAPRRSQLFRDLFGGGDRNSLRRAFVLKEILDAPASERSDRREVR